MPSGWRRAATPSGQDTLLDIFFPGSDTGYAITSKGLVLQSLDGGNAWSEFYHLPAGVHPNNLSVTPNGSVFVAVSGVQSGLYKCLNGTSWGYQPIGTDGYAGANSRDVFFIDNDTGYVSGFGASADDPILTGIWQTLDGGDTWSLVTECTETYEAPVAFSFGGVRNGALLHGFSVYYTGGEYNYWKKNALRILANWTSVAVASSSVIYIVNVKGDIYKSVNGGVSFDSLTSVTTPYSAGFFDLHFFDEQTGYVTGGNYLYRTRDGGATWLPVLRSADQLVEVHFWDPSHGWICGYNGTVITYRP